MELSHAPRLQYRAGGRVQMRQLPKDVRELLAAGVQVQLNDQQVTRLMRGVSAKVVAGSLELTIHGSSQDEALSWLREGLIGHDVVIEQRGEQHFAVYKQGAYERHLKAAG